VTIGRVTPKWAVGILVGIGHITRGLHPATSPSSTRRLCFKTRTQEFCLLCLFLALSLRIISLRSFPYIPQSPHVLASRLLFPTARATYPPVDLCLNPRPSSFLLCRLSPLLYYSSLLLSHRVLISSSLPLSLFNFPLS
jgi:hypothetical protein